jgi:response regulator of citrate/malate metabolism
LKDGAENEANAKEMIKAFNVLMSKYGATMRLSYSGKDESYVLVLDIDEEWAKRKLKRNAGRFKAVTTHKCEEIKEWQESGMSADEIAEQLGMSRSTYFRHLKRWKEHGNDERFF